MAKFIRNQINGRICEYHLGGDDVEGMIFHTIAGVTFDDFIYHWLEKLGAFDEKRGCPVTLTLDVKFLDKDWISPDNISNYKARMEHGESNESTM